MSELVRGHHLPPRHAHAAHTPGTRLKQRSSVFTPILAITHQSCAQLT